MRNLRDTLRKNAIIGAMALLVTSSPAIAGWLEMPSQLQLQLFASRMYNLLLARPEIGIAIVALIILLLRIIPKRHL